MLKAKVVLKVVLVCALLLIFTVPLIGNEGVIEINQAKVLAGSGFPKYINSPGRYKLTSNLTVTSSGYDGLVINADDVTIDLNGFSINGPWDGSSGCPSTGTAIYSSSGIHRLTILNGTVRRFRNGIMATGDNHVRVEKVLAAENCYYGIDVVGTVVNSMALDNGSTGILLWNGLATGNYVAGNGSYGLSIVNSGAYSGNYLVANNNNGSQVSGGTNTGGNICAPTACP